MRVIGRHLPSYYSYICVTASYIASQLYLSYDKLYFSLLAKVKVNFALCKIILNML